MKKKLKSYKVITRIRDGYGCDPVYGSYPKYKYPQHMITATSQKQAKEIAEKAQLGKIESVTLIETLGTIEVEK